MKSKIFIGVILLLSACLDTETISPYDQLQKDIKIIDDFLAANPPDLTDLVIKDATGVRLVITQVGTGVIPPNPENNLKVSYVGKLLSNGTVFDSNDAFFFRISDNIINGWKIGLSMMTEGTEATLYIPSGLGYGTKGTGGIPGNAILVFNISLLNVVPTDAQVTQLNSQVDAIDQKIDIEGVENVIQHESGIRMVINQIGTGASPSLYNQVTIKFAGRLLIDDTEILPLTERGPSADFSSRVVNYLHGLIIGMQQMQAGGKATIYIPAILAYGPVAVPNIPANSNLIYEVELISVTE